MILKTRGTKIMENERIELTILMPCLNEEKTIGSCILEAQEFIKNSGISAEILIADNGSTDKSADIARSLGARVVKIERRGYGSALIGGINAALGKYTIMGDCDMSYDFLHLDLFIEKLREGYDFVIGNRFKGGIENGAMPALHRFGVPFLSWVGSVVYKIKLGDFHCGLRGFDTDKARSLNLHCDGMEFASEIIGAFARSGGRIAEIPAVLRCDGRGRKSHLHTFRDGFRHLFFMLSDR